MPFRECAESLDDISGLQWAHYGQKHQRALPSLKDYHALGRFGAGRRLKPTVSKTQLSSPSSSPTIVVMGLMNETCCAKISVPKMTASVHSGKGSSRPWFTRGFSLIDSCHLIVVVSDGG